MSSTLLLGKLALITGAGGGIGRATAVRFAQEGATVIVTDRKIKQAEETAKKLGGTHLPLELDVTNADNVQSVIEEAINKYKRPPSITVNCAGITRDAFILKMDDSDFDLVLNVNLKGTYLVMKHVVQKMIEHKVGGAIVNISSITAKMGNMGQCNYAPSKAAVETLTRVAAKEFAKFGIRVNTVIPGFVHTPMTDHVPDKVKELILKQIALKRFGEPEEISDTIAFLSSDKSSFVTGASIEVSGGQS
ncbi:CLUMA_CG014012, isoform A [Clunio marinus]|uniref:(3R)-3-hydroxyacyl-CoA dehydrogenase n=1 Tax=Clunio marinus TaxID=568069 RepID=A0A1J1IMH0_9DIPT|nr:CLUMA_CG014012, isoform A [Clunio marinus]